MEVDEFQISVAETYDVIVTPTEDRAYTIVSEAIDRSGMGRATLAPRLGMSAEVPPLREVPNITMRDMGMDMGGMGGMDMSGAMPGMDHSGMDMSGMAGINHDMGAGANAMDHSSMDMSELRITKCGPIFTGQIIQACIKYSKTKQLIYPWKYL